MSPEGDLSMAGSRISIVTLAATAFRIQVARLRAGPGIAALTVAMIVGAVGLAGCGEDQSDAASGGAANASTTGAPMAGPDAVAPVSLEACPPSDAPGGYDLEVSDLSCPAAEPLLLVLSDPFGRYNEPQELIYRPKMGAATDWTCWASFDPDHPDIEHLCWRGSSVLRFKSG